MQTAASDEISLISDNFLQVPNLKEILLIGFYQPNEELNRFLLNAQQEFKISIRYYK